MLAPVSRYRPPTRPGSKFITAEGHARLATELDQLWRVERPAVTRAVSEAAAQGDRSENAEYTYGMVIVSNPPSDVQRVFFGAWVTLEDDAGTERRHRIVGPDEFDLAPGYISMDSPLARALLGKRLDDEVHVETPTGRRRLVILAIDYTGVKPPARS
jgi:transcription elongation factor GreB